MSCLVERKNGSLCFFNYELSDGENIRIQLTLLENHIDGKIWLVENVGEELLLLNYWLSQDPEDELQEDGPNRQSEKNMIMFAWHDFAYERVDDDSFKLQYRGFDEKSSLEILKDIIETRLNRRVRYYRV